MKIYRVKLNDIRKLIRESKEPRDIAKYLKAYIKQLDGEINYFKTSSRNPHRIQLADTIESIQDVLKQIVGDPGIQRTNLDKWKIEEEY